MKAIIRINLTKFYLAAGMTVILLLAGNFPASAFKPEITATGMLVLKADDAMSRTNTGYTAVVRGFGTWYKKYQTQIENYTINKKSSAYYDTLPGYGYTQVTAAKLSSLITSDADLKLQSASSWSWVIDTVTQALDQDRNTSAKYPKDLGYAWDPFDLWKWRSVYMESRYQENNSSTPIHSNCWGTADYLTRGTQWRDYYPYSKAEATYAYGVGEWGATFPHIYLNGWIYGNTYSIDNDLKYIGNFTLMTQGKASANLRIGKYLNAFDVIRMSNAPGTYNSDYELKINNVNLGYNVHCAAYLCTDASGKHWFYEKGNYGSTDGAPYGIRAFGNDPYWQYENSYRSLFMHDYNIKWNWNDSWDENWAGIVP